MLSGKSAKKKTSLSNPQVSLWQYIEQDILWMHREVRNSNLCYLTMSFEWMQNHIDLTVVRLADCKTSAPHGISCSRSCKMPKRSATVSGPSVAVTSNFLMWLNEDSTQPIPSCDMCKHTNVCCPVHVCHSVHLAEWRLMISQCAENGRMNQCMLSSACERNTHLNTI